MAFKDERGGTMKIGLLLIALGFGYKIFAEATVNPKKTLKKLGRVVGIIMMVLSLGATACMLWCMSTSDCGTMGKSYYGKKAVYCPFAKK